MRSPKRLTLCLLLPLSLLAVSACGHRAATSQTFPSAADLKVEPKPAPSPEILTSAKAEADYNIAVEAWGERGWRAVGRLCRWADERGMDLPAGWCPPAPTE